MTHYIWQELPYLSLSYPCPNREVLPNQSAPSPFSVARVLRQAACPFPSPRTPTLLLPPLPLALLSVGGTAGDLASRTQHQGFLCDMALVRVSRIAALQFIFRLFLSRLGASGGDLSQLVSSADTHHVLPLASHLHVRLLRCCGDGWQACLSFR